jgi:ATP-dependent DNA helicase
MYHGTRPERQTLRAKHMAISGQKSLSFPVVITSFEICMADRSFLEKYVW